MVSPRSNNSFKPNPLRGLARPGNPARKRRPTLAFLSGGAVAGMVSFAFLHWMLDGSTPVHFENRSGVPLQGVTISGAGFEASLGNVGPGGTVRVRVYPAGESAIRVAFRANGQVISTPHDVYFEGGGDDAVDVIVDANLKANVNIDSFSFRSMLLP